MGVAIPAGGHLAEVENNRVHEEDAGAVEEERRRSERSVEDAVLLVEGEGVDKCGGDCFQVVGSEAIVLYPKRRGRGYLRRRISFASVLSKNCV